MKIGDKVKLLSTHGIGVGRGVLEFTEGQEVVAEKDNLNVLGRLVASGVAVIVSSAIEEKPPVPQKPKE